MSGRSLLFVHQNFPGQFGAVAGACVARGDRVAAIGSTGARDVAGVDVRRWRNGRASTAGIFEAATRAEADLIRAEAAVQAALSLKADGFAPDVIIGHPGWGETLHLRDVFPDAPQVIFGEYFYNSRAADLGFDAEFQKHDLQAAMRANGKNATGALAYVGAKRIVCPTPFQASTFPASLQERITIHHEGVDTSRARRNPAARLQTPSGKVLSGDDEVITFINRQFEPMRGFAVFMRALPAVMKARPRAEIVLIGASEGPAYGGASSDGRSWRERMLSEVGGQLDPARMHWMGHVPHARMVDALSVSRAHVYYTYPFVLSWSLLEAMSCECLILGSDTAPVRDAVRSGENGLLHPFLEVQALSDALIQALQAPGRHEQLRRAARQTVLERFDQARVGTPGWIRIIDDVAA